MSKDILCTVSVERKNAKDPRYSHTTVSVTTQSVCKEPKYLKIHLKKVSLLSSEIVTTTLAKTEKGKENGKS